MVDKPDRSWEFFGKHDPYFGVLTEDKFHFDKLSDDALEEFFLSGQRHVDFIIESIHHFLDPQFTPRSALDFGCGVGRVLIPLARICTSVTGVDVSPSMLAEAKSNCARQGTSNVEFILSDDCLERVSGEFNLIHSYIVFQHIPRKKGELLFQRLVDLLEPGGIGALHVVYHRDMSSARRLLQWSRKTIPLVNPFVNLVLGQPLNIPALQMNVYNLATLLRILQHRNCHDPHMHLVVESNRYTTSYGAMIFFQKHKA